ncbi:hypothetical protein [Sedimenticola sp.]|uniref:hypothetical protein n=1 Tax=Sedimenticola sp. TaxID=1940285 RepID=UPI003D145FF9
MGEMLALGMMGGGILLFFIAVTIALWRVKHVSATVIAIRLAVISLLITLLMGLLLGSGVLGKMGFGHIAVLVDVHLGWGILGWVGLLLIGISYQVVPMFQVTPEYPRHLRRLLAPMLFVGLLIWTVLMLGNIAGIVEQWLAQAWMLLLVAGFVFYSIITLRLQQQRKRRVADITMLFWRTGMLFVPLCALIWMAGMLSPAVALNPHYNLLLGVCLLLGVGVSVINGMLYKIVPFLSWFHLQNRQMSMMCMTVKVPNMKEFISDKAARLQFRLFLLTLLLALAASLYPGVFAYLAGLFFFVSNTLLLKNLLVAMFRYRTTHRALLAYAASVSADDKGLG